MGGVCQEDSFLGVLLTVANVQFCDNPEFILLKRNPIFYKPDESNHPITLDGTG
jgi:hypothetical protein